jgi:hypothetical protein
LFASILVQYGVVIDNTSPRRNKAMTNIGIEMTIRAANRLLWLLKYCLLIPTVPAMRENVPPNNKSHIALFEECRGNK